MPDVDDPDDQLAVVEGVNNAVAADAKAPALRLRHECGGVEPERIALQLGQFGQNSEGHVPGDLSKLRLGLGTEDGAVLTHSVPASPFDAARAFVLGSPAPAA